VAVVLGLLFRAQQKAADDLAAMQSTNRLAEALRADVHASVQIEPPRAGALPAVLLLNRPDGTSVTYTATGTGATRTEVLETPIQRREDFRFPFPVRVQFSVDADRPNWVRCTVEWGVEPEAVYRHQILAAPLHSSSREPPP
jgi:hypothetical protein